MKLTPMWWDTQIDEEIDGEMKGTTLDGKIERQIIDREIDRK